MINNLDDRVVTPPAMKCPAIIIPSGGVSLWRFDGTAGRTRRAVLLANIGKDALSFTVASRKRSPNSAELVISSEDRNLVRISVASLSQYCRFARR